MCIRDRICTASFALNGELNSINLPCVWSSFVRSPWLAPAIVSEPPFTLICVEALNEPVTVFNLSKLVEQSNTVPEKLADPKLEPWNTVAPSSKSDISAAFEMPVKVTEPA